MAAEKLPPDGYELGPGWEVGGGFCCTCRHWKEESVYRHDPLKRGDADASCGRVECAIAMGAIVRKAEAPEPETFAQFGAQVFRTAAAPPEQPSRNPLQLPAEAPAAPVGEPRLPLVVSKYPGQVFVVSDDHIWKGPPPRELEARIAALEADVAARLVERDGWMEAAARSEREKAALQAELAEATSHVNDVAEAYRRTLAAWEAKYVESFTMLAEANAACVAAVQAERDRCAATLDEWLAGRIGRLSECRQRIGDGTPIKNGDPKP